MMILRCSGKSARRRCPTLPRAGPKKGKPPGFYARGLPTLIFDLSNFSDVSNFRPKINVSPSRGAQPERQGLTYAGSAFIALSRTERDELSARLAMSKAERSPVPKLRFPDVQWVKPNLVARVRHLAGAK